MANAAADEETHNPARIFAFKPALLLVLLRFGMLHQTLSYLAHFNLRLLYVFGIPALLGLALSGGIRRSFRASPAWYWTAYMLWMGLAVPFSTWRGDSLRVFGSYVTHEYIVLLVIAGLAVTWRDCEALMRIIAWGGIISAISAAFFQSSDSQGRLALGFGTVANANDLACHLLLVLPFVLWLVFRSSWPIVRIFGLGGVGLGVFTILHTGSRGGAVALLAAIVFFLYRGTFRQRIAFLGLCPIIVAALAVAVPSKLVFRLQSYSRGDAGAVESADARRNLLENSIKYTVQHPVFGVGPGQFPNYEGQNNLLHHGHGLWQGTHNTFTQVSSECGIPGLFFFVAGMVSTYRLLSATYRKARQRPDCPDIRNATFCIMMGMIGFGVAMTFLNFAYFFYQPALGGLAIAFSSAAEREFASRVPAPQPPMAASFGRAVPT